jgi:acylglycerol lipase
LQKLEFLKDFKAKQPLFIKASDGSKLAYYEYMPKSPKAIILFYHGAGFYSSALYQNFAKELAEKYSIGCYLFDIRGHGNSEGTRGDAPSINQV